MICIISLAIQMKVSELKALFEKNAHFKDMMAPAVQSILKSPSLIQSKALFTNLSNIQSIKEPLPSSVQSSPLPARRNNEFMNELNKKLMNKSRIISEEVQQDNQEPNCRQSRRYVQKVEEQLNFDDIIGNIQKTQVMRSGLRARLGINQRNPSTQEQVDIFAELEIQRQSESKKNEQLTEHLLYRVTKLQTGAYRYNPLYSKLQKKDKIARIDQTVCNIFGKRQKEFIANTSKEPLIKPETIIKEAQIINQAKNEEFGQILFDSSSQFKRSSSHIPNRTQFAMSKEMLSEMNMKIKKRIVIVNAEETLQPQQVKKKKHFQKFDDS